jgi:hypothetical protein
MALFDSGPMPAGTAEIIPVIGAGRYPFACSIHPSMTGQLKVGVLANPSSGSRTTAFTVQWASAPAPDGFVFDVQIKRPGTSTWKTLLNDMTSGGISFTPDMGGGTYGFRARTQRISGPSTAWSAAKNITVA